MILTAVGYATISNAPFNKDRRAFAAPVSGLSMPAATTSNIAGDASVLRGGVQNRTLPGATAAAIGTTDEVTNDISAFSTGSTVLPTPTATEQPLADQEDPLAREAAAVATPVPEKYVMYTAQEGDNVSSIAERHGLSTEYVVANNAELVASDTLIVGQSLILPTVNGILHEIRLDDTLSTIADRYAVDVQSIIDFPANEITDPNAITEATLLLVPNATIPSASAPFEEPPTDDEVDEAPVDEEPLDDGSGDDGSDDTSDGEIVGGGPSSDAGLIWPLGGPVSSYYGSGHPLGIDIDGFNLPGAAIAAATSGTVVFAGGNACCSYGLYVVIVSDTGLETLYAHMDSLLVSQGEYVSQGQAIGIVGNTGYSTGRHVHFEVIDNGVRQDPLTYLP